MTNPVDHEAVQAAQALCMLAMDTRQQSVDTNETQDEDCIMTHARPVVHSPGVQQNIVPDETEDEDCIITHARPVVHRHHPYRRPEPQRVGVPAARSGMSPSAEAERMAREREYLHRDKWNVFPLEQHEMQPGAPVPEVRRVVRNGEVVLEKGPLPHTQPSVVPRPTPVEQPIPARRPLPGQQPPPGVRPSPSQPPTPTEGDASPDVTYSFRALALQALLASPEGRWLSTSDIADYIEENYPQFREEVASQKSVMRGNAKSVLWRLPAWARKEVATMAWNTKRGSAPPQPSHSGARGQALVSMPYAPKSLMLQALLAVPEGRWTHLTELVGYLLTQYPQ
ncbi:hypothetical protein INS49_005038 [Diaporthe citri]|uniref:uncharacterized protein n=1 Tax=Diaporthe citri TaxID=83186 RepID=UPI001C7E3C0D|nr:uncharacterized protein INS49_005038 [Diaporthe citri]KAG6354067.1 hypothetical protein INS49_005038 [Diaporthe citri]